MRVLREKAVPMAWRLAVVVLRQPSRRPGGGL
jgi:hypothetical protein